MITPMLMQLSTLCGHMIQCIANVPSAHDSIVSVPHAVNKSFPTDFQEETENNFAINLQSCQ
jgi:hypothetical protein